MGTTATQSPTPLTPCKGDWLQRGCASGLPSVHNVLTHDVERDCCAVHSPFDVKDAYPVGSIIRYADQGGSTMHPTVQVNEYDGIGAMITVPVWGHPMQAEITERTAEGWVATVDEWAGVQVLITDAAMRDLLSA